MCKNEAEIDDTPIRPDGGDYLNKKIVILIMTLSMLFVVTPALAAPAATIPYTADVELDMDSPGDVWVTAGGIQQIKGAVAEGSFVSADLGITGMMVKEFDCTINVNTGKGTIRGKFVLTVDDVGTLEGSFWGKVTDGTHLAGGVVGHGTGGFEGLKTMGTWEGDIIGSQIVNVLDAILLSPQG
jgi:hypothetical protein